MTFYVSLGNAYIKKSDFDKALDSFNKAIKLDKKSINAFIGKGSVLYEKKEYDEASKAFDNALDLDENNEYALIGKGNVLSAQGNTKAAEEYYTKADSGE